MLLHANAITQNSASGSAAGGVDGDHRHPLTPRPQFADEGAGEGALPCPRRSGNTDDQAPAGGQIVG
jgi:hypothetical protein